MSLAGWKTPVFQGEELGLVAVVFYVSKVRSCWSLHQPNRELPKTLHTSPYSLKSYHICIVAETMFTKLCHLNPTLRFQAQYFTVPPESTCYIIHRLYKNEETSHMCITHHHLGEWQVVIHQGQTQGRSVDSWSTTVVKYDWSLGKYNFTCTPYFLIILWHISEKIWHDTSSWFANWSITHSLMFLFIQSFNKCWLSTCIRPNACFLTLPMLFRKKNGLNTFGCSKACISN